VLKAARDRFLRLNPLPSWDSGDSEGELLNGGGESQSVKGKLPKVSIHPIQKANE